MSSPSPLPEFNLAQLILVGFWALYVAAHVCYAFGMDLLLVALLFLAVVVIFGGVAISHFVWLLLLVLLIVWLVAGVGRSRRL